MTEHYFHPQLVFDKTEPSTPNTLVLLSNVRYLRLKRHAGTGHNLQKVHIHLKPADELIDMNQHFTLSGVSEVWLAIKH
jgi:hypothetical protein